MLPSVQPSALQLRPQRDLLLGWLLLLLDRAPSHGYDLTRSLQERFVGADSSAIYRLLRSLERDGWVSSRWVEATAGPRRRMYSLTAKGRRGLDQAAGTIALHSALHLEFLSAYGGAVRRRGPPATKKSTGDGDGTGAGA